MSLAIQYSPAYRRLWRAVLRLKLALIDRRRYERVVLEDVNGIPLLVLPDVFNPKLLRSGAFLVEQVLRFVPGGAHVLDLGSGSGGAGVAAALKRCIVTAVDINPSAVRCTRLNALLSNVDIDVRHGDLFTPVADDRYDVVLFNPPYYKGVPRDGLDHAWRSIDVPEQFATQLADHLTPGGYALLVLSTDGQSDLFLDALSRRSFTSDVVATRDFINEVMRVYRVQPC